MLTACRRLYYYWAYLDLQHTCDKRQTYFWRYAKDIGHTNLSTIRYIAAFFGFLCAFVVIATAALDAPFELCLTYAVVSLFEVGFFILSSIMRKKSHDLRFDSILTIVCLIHLLTFGAYIGTALSPDESASVFMVTLLLSQILFTLPPIVTTTLSALATIGALIASHYIKTDFFFRIDVMDCTGVFLISLLVGWLVNKMRVEEATARTRVQQLNNELKYMSATDQLTNLPNHRSFQETYYTAFEAARTRHENLGVIMMDIDQFKAYNDNYGHIEGDRCLTAIGGVLRSFSNDDIYICRFGGEEFLALLHPPVCGQANEIAERIRSAVQALGIEHAYSRIADTVTISTGIYVGIPEFGDLPMLFVDHADRAMYQSKADGGNRTTSFTDIFLTDSTSQAMQEKYVRLTNRGRESLRRKLLIVDDSAVNRLILRKILSFSYQILEAESGQQALDILYQSSDSISAVLLDIVMPGMDGYSVLTKIRASVALSDIPVIVTTGSSDEETEVKALSLGANDFFPKPYKPIVIKQRVENAINLRETAAIINAVEKDSLTGVYSKTFFCSKADAFIRANLETRYDIIYLDIEQFHLINELFGTRTGDALLKFFSELVVANIGSAGLLGRIDADRFACLIPHRDVYRNADFAAAAEAVNAFPISFDIRIRCGIYVIDDLSIPFSAMCDRAMIACNSVKGKSDALFAYYNDTLREQTLSKQFILDGLKAGLAEKQFIVYYQPKYSLSNGEIIGAEALVRWMHPEHGLLLPSLFVPLFEKHGSITELDIYVWESVCSDMQRWISTGHKSLPVSVNFSRADIYHPELPKTLLALVERHGLTPDLLHLEIAETACTEDSEQLIQAILEFRALGFAIEMDDFGAYYSSLNMLSSLPINMLKLDMRFTQMEKDSAQMNSILTCIIELANRLHLPVIAEGVETQAQAEYLRSLGCNFAQGYYYNKPMPADTFGACLP